MGGGHVSRSGDRIGELLLAGQAQELTNDLWTSPVATDRANRGSRARKNPDSRRGGECNLADDAENFPYSPQAQPIHDGQTSLPPGQTLRRQLNARFVTWLMGLPYGWERIEPMNCAAWETLFARCKEQWRLLCFGND